MISLILILCEGCKSQEKSLTLCVSSNIVEQADDLIDAWQQFNKDIEVNLVVIPRKADEAAIKIAEIRTAIMSGEGPDVFILNTDIPSIEDGLTLLFDNVEKIMHSEIFLPLDKYMDQAQHMHIDAFNSMIFNSGKTDDGQLVLPMFYEYYAGAVVDNGDASLEELPYSWDDLVNKKDFDLEENNIPQFSYGFFNVFGKYANYESHSLLYTETEMLTRVQEAISFNADVYSSEWFEDGLRIGPIDTVLSWTKGNENYIFNAIPSTEGGITANVTMYATINRNTRWPKESFSILDVLFSDEVMTGRGFDVGEKTYGNVVIFPGLCNGILVHENACLSSYNLSDECIQAFYDLNKRITNVRYYSDLDADLLEMYNECRYAKDEDEQKKIVSQIYNRMQMKLAE